MRNILIMGFALMAIYACSDNTRLNMQAEVPNTLINREEMIKILMEIHLAESGVAMMAIDHHRSIGLYKQYHAEILKKHQIDTAIYNKNYDYYMQKPLEMEYILTMVEDSLVKVQATAKKGQAGGGSRGSYPNMFPKSATGQDSIKQ